MQIKIRTFPPHDVQQIFDDTLNNLQEEIKSMRKTFEKSLNEQKESVGQGYDGLPV